MAKAFEKMPYFHSHLLLLHQLLLIALKGVFFLKGHNFLVFPPRQCKKPTLVREGE
jgi:hypothetical protein